MHSIRSVNLFRTALLLGLILAPTMVCAQSIWTEHLPGRAFTVEYLQPNFSGSSSSSGDFVLFLAGRFPAWEDTRLVIDLPVARGSRESDLHSDGESNTIVGNPYLGVEIRRPDSNSYAEIGFRMPITPGDSYLARNIGQMTDIDRQEAFLTDIFTASIIGNFLVDPPIENSSMRIRFGPAFWLGSGNIDVLLDYSLQGSYTMDRVKLTTGISGRFIATSDIGDFGARTLHQFGVSGSVNLDRYQPGLFLRLPIDKELSDSIDFVLGLTLGIAFD